MSTIDMAESVGSASTARPRKQKILSRKARGKKGKAVLITSFGSRTDSTARFMEYTFDPRAFAVQKLKGVCGGEPSVAGTRVTVRTLAQLNRQGETVRQLADAFNLELGQVEEALSYAKRNREEIDELIRENERA